MHRGLSSENLRALDFNTLGFGGRGVVTSTKHVFFFQVNLLCMIFFGYMMFAGFFILNITLELFCVFRNTEYNVSKYAHFS